MTPKEVAETWLFSSFYFLFPLPTQSVKRYILFLFVPCQLPCCSWELSSQGFPGMTLLPGDKAAQAPAPILQEDCTGKAAGWTLTLACRGCMACFLPLHGSGVNPISASPWEQTFSLGALKRLHSHHAAAQQKCLGFAGKLKRGKEEKKKKKV